VADHPDAVVLDLGAGLNDRMFRIAPPPTVDRYDVDFPEVIALRRSALREHAQAHYRRVSDRSALARPNPA
jgi:O-methyltransferase involved in polyketide biosynthesis